MNIMVNVNITAPELVGAIDRLASALAEKQVTPSSPRWRSELAELNEELDRLAGSQELPYQEARQEQAAVEAADAVEEAEAVAEETVSSTEEAVTQPNPEPIIPLAPEPTYTLEQLALAASPLIDAGLIDNLNHLLNNKYGVVALNQLDAGKYPAFAADIRALGAKL